MTLATTMAAELEAVRAERDRLRLTLTGTRAALDLVQEECDAAHERLHAAKSDLAAVEALHDATCTALAEAGEMRRELARRMGLETAAKVAAEGALAHLIGTGKVGECTVTGHPDGHMTLAWDPEDADRCMASREFIDQMHADGNAFMAQLAHAEQVAARLVQVIWEDAHWIARLTDQRDTARHFNRKNATRADATAIDLRECEEAYAGAEWVAARLVEVICNEAERTARWQREWRAALAATPVTAGRIADERDEAWSAYRRAADDRDKAEAALAESEARGDEWSRVAHGWAMERDDARRRAEEAERAYRGHPLAAPAWVGALDGEAGA